MWGTPFLVRGAQRADLITTAPLVAGQRIQAKPDRASGSVELRSLNCGHGDGPVGAPVYSPGPPPGLSQRRLACQPAGRGGAGHPAAVPGRQAEGTRALRQRLIAKKPIPAAASAAAPPPAASGTLLPPLRLPPPPVLAPPAGVNPVTVGPEDRVAEGATAAGVVAESLGAVGAGVVAESLGVGATRDGAGVVGGAAGWWCLHLHVGAGSGVVDGGVVGAVVLVPTVCWLTWAGDTVAA